MNNVNINSSEIKFPHTLIADKFINEFEEFVADNNLNVRFEAGYAFVSDENGNEVVYQPEAYNDASTFVRLSYVPEVMH